jgi:hypothetical protein
VEFVASSGLCRFSKAGFVSIEDHAKWKYLLSADGCVAQTRLVKVMLANSVVIKEESDWIEYYYRCGSVATSLCVIWRLRYNCAVGYGGVGGIDVG